MDFATLFTEQRWNILAALAEDKYSPLQLAEKSSTTMANISQQLRLLEASRIVKKEKISNRDKGKPRTLFSLSRDHAYLICAMKGFSEKKLVSLDKLHAMLMRSWFMEDAGLCYYVEKFVWEIEDSLDKIEFMAFKASGEEVETALAALNAADLEKKLKDKIVRKAGGGAKTFKIKLYSPEEAEKLAKQHKGFFSSSAQIHVVYDPYLLISKSTPTGGDV